MSCLCKTIPESFSANQKLAFHPPDLIKQLMDLKEENILSGCTETTYQCKTCQNMYLLVEDIGYHYPTFTFKLLNQSI